MGNLFFSLLNTVDFLIRLLVYSLRTPEKAGNIVFKNVNIFPMIRGGEACPRGEGADTGENVLENYSLWVSQGKIMAMGKYDELEFSADAIIIDCQNKFLVPGFGDMHVHAYRLEDYPLFLANGVTLIRHMWGTPLHLILRKIIRNKQFLGPELFTAGPIIDGKDPAWPQSIVIEDPGQVEGVIRKMKTAGYDAIKVYHQLSRAVYDTIIETAKKLDIPVVGHIPREVGVTAAIQAGQYSNEHLSGYDFGADTETMIDLTVRSGMWNCPTLVVWRNLTRLSEFKNKKIPELRFVPPLLIKQWSKRNSSDFNLEGAQRFLKALYDQGGRIVAGTDVGGPYLVPGFSLHEEFQLMREAGLTPYQIILTTTKEAARMLGIEERLGTIEIGKEADLVLLDKNPLEDIQNTKTIAGVMAKGVWLPKEKLQSMLDAVERRYHKKRYR